MKRSVMSDGYDSHGFICECLHAPHLSGHNFDGHYTDAVIGAGLIANRLVHIALDSAKVQWQYQVNALANNLTRHFRLAAGQLRIHVRPLAVAQFQLEAGMSIGHNSMNGYGTLGGFLINKKQERHFIVSNNHVLALNNAAAIGDAVHYGNRRIGSLSAFVNLDYSGRANQLDLAVARVDSDENIAISRYRKIRPARVGEFVTKMGATTLQTYGQIISTDYTCKVGYGAGRSAVFTDQLYIKGQTGSNFSEPGDSGSFISAQSDGAFVGLLFAGENNSSATFANQSVMVLNQFKKWGFYQ